MHIRYHRAAVEIDEAPTHGSQRESASPTSDTGSPGRPPVSQPLPTLWASRTLPVRQGRVIGVRLRASAIEVALVAAGADTLTWVDPNSVLDESQVGQWLRTARFSRSGG